MYIGTSGHRDIGTSGHRDIGTSVYHRCFAMELAMYGMEIVNAEVICWFMKVVQSSGYHRCFGNGNSDVDDDVLM